MTPKSPKELVRMMLSSDRTLDRFYAAVREADELLQKRMTVAVQSFLRDNDVDISGMSHNDVTTALNTFYKKARLAGRYVRLW